MLGRGKILSGIPWQDARPIKIASASLCLNIDHTTVASSGTVYAVDIDSANTTAGIVNYRALAVDLTMGASCAGPYAGYFRTDCVGYQVTGLGAALGMELCLPGATLASGEFHGMTIDFECPTSFSTGTGGKHSFIKMEIWGETTEKNIFDDAFNLFFLNGMTSALDNLVSANEQTLRINIEGTTRYLMLSHMQDGLGLGLTGTKMPLGDGLHAIDIHCSTVLTGNTERSIPVEINLSRTATGGSGTCRDWGLKVNLTSTHKYPSGANAIYGAMTFVAAGVHGRGAALQGEIIMPNAQLVRGAFSCLHLDMTCGASTNVGSSGPLSFISLNMETDATEMDRGGYLFEIQGLAEGDGKLIDSTGGDLAVEGGIRCVFGTTPFWLLYTTTEPA